MPQTHCQAPQWMPGVSLLTRQSNWSIELDGYVAPELESSALVIIDTQMDFLDGGVSPIGGTNYVVPRIAELLDAYRARCLPIFHIVRLYEGDDVENVRRRKVEAGAGPVRPGTMGSQIAVELRPPNSPDLDPARLLSGELQSLGSNEVVLWKPRWSAFYRTRLDDHLADLRVSTVLFAGCNFPHCPRASIYDATERDFKVLVASDAISGINDVHLEELEGIGGVHASVGAITSRFERRAEP